MASKSKQKKRRQRARRAARRREGTQQEATDRRRTRNAEAIAENGVPLDEPQIIVAIEPVQLPSDDKLWFQSPFVVPFYLLKSKALRDAAEPRRESAVTRTVEANDGDLRPRNPSSVLDALEDLALSVIMAVAAIEAHANDMIGRLPDDAMVEVRERIGGKTIAVMRDKAAMDRLPLSDKLSRTAPLLHGTESIKGTASWQAYKRLSRLRNALVHPRREAVTDPASPSVFGKLLLGEGSSAPEDAAMVIEALEANYLPENIRPDFGLPARVAEAPG